MRLPLLAVVAVGFCLGADTPRSEDAKKELDKMQGTWVVTSGEQEGVSIPEDQAKSMKLIVQGDSYTFTSQQETEKGTLAPDPSKTPKALDIHITEGPQKGQTQQAIYELEDDTLKVCFAQPGQERPTDMSAKANSKRGLLVFKHEKP